MAGGYDINLNIALKNSQKLKQLKNDLTDIAEKQKDYNKKLKDGNKIAVATFNKLNKQLFKANKLLNKAAYGTESFEKAARALVNVEKEHNHQLKEKERILNKLRREINDPTYELRQKRKQQIRENIRQNRALRFTNVNPGRPAVVGDYGQSGGRIGPAQALNNRQGGFLGFNEIAKKLDGTNLKNLKQNTKTASILASQATAANFRDIGFGIRGGQIGPALPAKGATPPTFWNNMGFGRNAQDGPFAMQGGAMARARGGIGSAMIGGGFPFLFGAGGLSAAMGAGAGAIGGALAPGGGFALSIAATAIASQIEEARKFSKELKLVNAQLLAVGNSSIYSKREIKNLAKELNITKEEATQLIDRFVPRFSKEETKALKDVFGKEGVGAFDAIAAASDVQTLIDQIIVARDLIGQSTADSLLADVKTKTNLEVMLRLTEEIGKANRKNKLEALSFGEVIDGFDFTKLVNTGDNLQRFLAQLDPNSELGKRLKGINPNTKFYSQIANQVGPGTYGREVEPLFRKEFYDFIKPLDESIAKTKELTEYAREYQFHLQELAEFKAPVYELEKLMRPQRQILELSKAMKSSFEDSFKGLIRGTMSVADAFRNMFNRIADAYIDMVAKMFANQIQKGFLSMFAGMFSLGGGGGDKFIGGSDYWDPKTGKGIGGPNYGLADGGTARSGKSYLVGERGPEIFTPKNTGTVIPNHELGGVGGGSTNISVNIDASGTSVEGSEPNGEELGRLVAAAIQSELIKEKRPGGLLS